METDFLDDPKRPGAVLGPKTIAKRTQQLSGELFRSGYSEAQVSEILENIHSNWPKILYS
jgi:TatD-related deoxyribonuclease